MTNEELNTALYQRLFAEQEKWRDWLLRESPEEILNHAFEYSSREDIILALEYSDLSDEDCLALLKSPCPLSDIFTEFQRAETGHMDDIRQCIENRANHIIQLEKQRVGEPIMEL
jgi:hypothetical protein